MVNSHEKLAKQDSASHQTIFDGFDGIERNEVIQGIQAGLADLKAGRTRSAAEVHEELRKRYEVSD
jgi:predicted transcriptional regulator